MESILLLDGKIIFSAIKKKDMDFYGVDSQDLDGIIGQLRVTAGVECALFLYEKAEGQFKVSLRSNDKVDVRKVARISEAAVMCGQPAVPWRAMSGISSTISPRLSNSSSFRKKMYDQRYFEHKKRKGIYLP